MDNEIYELIRDITKAGFMPKSEATRRIFALLDKAREEARLTLIREIKETVEGMFINDHISGVVAQNAYNQAIQEFSDFLTKLEK